MDSINYEMELDWNRRFIGKACIDAINATLDCDYDKIIQVGSKELTADEIMFDLNLDQYLELY